MAVAKNSNICLPHLTIRLKAQIPFSLSHLAFMLFAVSLVDNFFLVLGILDRY